MSILGRLESNSTTPSISGVGSNEIEDDVSTLGLNRISNMGRELIWVIHHEISVSGECLI